MRTISQAARDRLQGDEVHVTILIDLEHPAIVRRWTMYNKPLTATLSGQTHVYTPFPGVPGSDNIAEGTDLGVETTEFVIANSGGEFDALFQGQDFDAAQIVLTRIFPDTPDMMRMEVFRGKLGDYSWNRLAIKGQVRNDWDSANVQWPYLTYQDNCVWRFGGGGCGVSVGSFTINSIYVAANSSSRLTVQTSLAGTYADDYFTFGRLKFISGQNSGAQRTIIQYKSGGIQILPKLPYAPSSGDRVQIYPGCRKRMIDDCTSKFNNQKNYLGFPWIPIQEDYGSFPS